MIQFLTNMIYSNKADDVACKSPSSKACLKPLKKKKISKKVVKSMSNRVIKSSMFMPYYDSSRSLTLFQLPNGKKLYFIASSTIVNQITQLEEASINPFTVRKQAYKFNQALLSGNPVAMSSISDQNYCKSQHKLFVSLAKEINLGDLNFPSQTISEGSISSFIIECTAKIYLPILLNVDANRIHCIMSDFEDLLQLLESATGKHGITFADYLNDEPKDYSNELEGKYLLLFHKIILQLKDTSTYTPSATSSSYQPELQSHRDTDISNSYKQHICNEILFLLRDSAILSVLETTFDVSGESVVIVNNILSWIDNMLNVTYTIVNFIVLLGSSRQPYDKEFYTSNLPKARALATMFMRHVTLPFSVCVDAETQETIQLEIGDILMLSNGNIDTTFGGQGRKCPSRPWSYIFMNQFLTHITTHYDIQSSLEAPPVRNRSGVKIVMPEYDDANDSWFWNKLSTRGIHLYPKQNKYEI